MNTDIDGQALTRFEVAKDGASLKLHLTDRSGQPASLSLPIECLNQLMMTLPRMVTQAVQRRHNDPSLRIVYPVCRSALELGSDLRTRILTLETSDGFNVSFGLSAEQCESIAHGDARVAEIARDNARMN